MSKLDRIQQLHRLLISHRRPVPLRTIASRLECSERTARRLIEDLQNYFDAPVEYNRDQNGWHYNPRADRFELPGLWLTGAELQSLVLLLEVLDRVGKSLLGEELAVVERQVHRLLEARHIDPGIFSRHIKVLPLGNRHLPNRIFERIGAALLQRRRLTIRYEDYARRRSRRTVSPQTLVYYRDNWYLDAWCHLRHELRVFSLARIEALTIEDEEVLDVPDESLQSHFGASYGIFAGQGVHTARLRFLPEAAREISMQQWHPEQEGEWEGEDYLLSFPYANPTELIGDILRQVPHVVVESPPGLREAVRQRLIDGLARYN